MYHKKPQGWFKHIDFMLWDVLCLHLAFVFAYITRHGWANPYGNRIYFNIIFVYTAVDFIVLIMNDTLKSVLKRGFYKEFAQSLKHTCLVELIIFLYLFTTQDGSTLEFEVSELEYGRMDNGETGTLEYRGWEYLGLRRYDLGTMEPVVEKEAGRADAPSATEKGILTHELEE